MIIKIIKYYYYFLLKLILTIILLYMNLDFPVTVICLEIIHFKWHNEEEVTSFEFWGAKFKVVKFYANIHK